MTKNTSKNQGFRSWFYFREGWTNYFVFMGAAVNTLTVTYYLAIEKVPALTTIFPTFAQYIIIVTAIGIPLLIMIGFAHWKKTAARKAEIDILFEENPYMIRTIVNTEIALKLSIRTQEKLKKASKGEKLTEEDIEEISKLHKEVLEFVQDRKFRGKSDWRFITELDKQWKEKSND